MGYSPVYSNPFILYTQDTPNTEFEVPDGFTAIVRDVIIYSEVGGEEASVGFYQPGSEYRVVFAALEAIGVNTTEEWHGRVVVTAGGLIDLIVSSLATYSSVYVGGYLLTNNVS